MRTVCIIRLRAVARYRVNRVTANGDKWYPVADAFCATHLDDDWGRAFICRRVSLRRRLSISHRGALNV
jgi:hypothetical protein